ncbi:MAG: glycosyltransferase, partial [Actinomycetota bacterium]|nr:glycosyltransferase [Actinomycetota bacterium]
MLLENQTYPRDVRVRNEALALVRHQHAVTVIAPRGAGEAAVETVEGVTVWRYRLPVSSGGVLGFLAEYLVAHVQLFARACVALAGGATVLHLHNPPDTLFPIALVGRALGRKIVFDQHDLSPELYRAKFGSSPIVRVLAGAQRLAARAAHASIATNLSQEHVLRVRAGVPADRVVVVRNGPRLEKLLEARPGRPVLDGGARLLFLGELEAQDRASSLPALLARPGFEQARLTVVGQGPDGARVQSEAERLGVGDRVRLTGWVPHDQVFELLAEADICLDPAPPGSFGDRSTMTKIAEYLAAGRPVVAFDLVETRRTAEDCALYASGGDFGDFATQVLRLVDDDDLRAELSRRALRRARDLVWERSERGLLELYQRLAPVTRTERPGRPAVAVLAWNSERKRADELGAALAGEGRTFYDLQLLHTALVPLRYAISTARTISYLARRRPRSLILQSPPVIPPLIGYVYARMARVPFVL